MKAKRNIQKICWSNYPGESIGFKFLKSESELLGAISETVSEPFRVIPTQSEKIFISRLMKNGQKSIQFNSRYKFELIRCWNDQDQFKSNIRFGLIQARIDSGLQFGVNVTRVNTALATLGRVHFTLITIATMPPLVYNLLLCAWAAETRFSVTAES